MVYIDERGMLLVLPKLLQYKQVDRHLAGTGDVSEVGDFNRAAAFNNDDDDCSGVSVDDPATSDLSLVDSCLLHANILQSLLPF